MMKRCLLIVSVFILMSAAALANAPGGALSISTGPMQVTMAADTGWTIASVTYEDTELIIPAGGQGAVMTPASGGWYGSGYDQGEEVTSLSVTVDGQPDNLEDRHLKGDTITVVKESQIGDMDHTAETTFEGDTIRQKHSFTLRDDIDFTHFYPFIYSVTPETTEWLGKTLDGEELSDIFDTSKNYEFNRDALWAAQYHAT
ncbi:MAG: hypothetical protein R6V19_05455, partial [Armatimonadota bacterium]